MRPKHILINDSIRKYVHSNEAFSQFLSSPDSATVKISISSFKRTRKAFSHGTIDYPY